MGEKLFVRREDAEALVAECHRRGYTEVRVETSTRVRGYPWRVCCEAYIFWPR